MQKMRYLDNAATSWPKPESVYREADRFAREVGASPGRSGHCLAQQADNLVEETRQLLAGFFNVPDARNVAFTHNCTDGLNLVIKGLLMPGDHAVTSTVEHNSVSRPLRRLERQGVDVTYLQADREGFIHADELEQVLRPETRLVIVTHASNMLGAISDVTALARVAHRHGALLALDAAQTAGHVPIDMQAMGIDILIVAGHKGLLGPFGTGAVLTIRDLDLPPWRDGGTGTRSDSRLHPWELPHRLEGGTLNAVGIAGLQKGVEFILEQGLERIRRKEQQHMQQILDCLSRYPQATILGPRQADQRAGLVSFNLQGLTPDELGQRMNDQFQIAGRPGLHCAPMAHRTAGTFPLGSYRLSPGFFTKEEDIEAVERALRVICDQ